MSNERPRRVRCLDEEVIPRASGYSLPTEEVGRRKEKLKARHAIKPKKFVPEQHSDDMGNDLSSLTITMEVQSWTPELLGAKSESCNLVDEFESRLLEFHLGRSRWMHGSSAAGPMIRIRKRGQNSLKDLEEQSSKILQDDTVIDAFEVFGGDGNTTWILYKRHGCCTGLEL